MATNQFGLDQAYFAGKLKGVLQDIEHFTPDEMARTLGRLAKTASASVLQEAEFGTVRVPEVFSHSAPPELVHETPEVAWSAMGYAKAKGVPGPFSGIDLDSMGQAASDWLAQNDASQVDWCDSHNVDALIQAIIAGTKPGEGAWIWRTPEMVSEADEAAQDYAADIQEGGTPSTGPKWWQQVLSGYNPLCDERPDSGGPVPLVWQDAVSRLLADKRCNADPMNPCFDNRPDDVVGQHIGGEPACAVCTVRGLLKTASATGPCTEAQDR